MTAPLGRALILLALLAASAGCLLNFAVASRPAGRARAWGLRAGYAYFWLMAAANALMVWALLRPDFSVSYVAQVGSRATPHWVRVVSLWSSLEGSILFWGLVLGGYIALATKALEKRHPRYLPHALGVWLACGAFFAFLLAGPAQPFQTIDPAPQDGPGPNALLQNHLLMVIHPPFLYLGYVGMVIPFGLASAALLRGTLGVSFMQPLRTWLLLPWTFLTVAIVLGGWWAYEVLGWGGYWAWDPVENASLLPWLTATAALHSALLMERRGALKGWTIALVQATFLLTILGTFMTRSGVFNSVHSFTQSAIGPTLLAFLAVALVWSVVLLAMRVDSLASEPGRFEGSGRETAFLVNNLLFVLFTFTVLVGTLFPLVVEAARGVQMSVGRPYFDRMAVPIGAALLFLMGVGPALPWGRVSFASARAALLPPLVSGVVVAAIGAASGARNPWTLVTLLFGGYALQVTVSRLKQPLQKGGPAALARPAGLRITAGYLAHLGAVIIIVAIAVSSTMDQSKEVQLRAGESTEIGSYKLTFLGADDVREPHRTSIIARIGVERGGRDLGILEPRMNQYDNQREPIGTPAVRSGLVEDLYLSVMNIDPLNQTVGLMAKVNPMVSWIWIATAIMGLGGILGTIAANRRAQEEPGRTPPLASPAPAQANR